MRPPVFTLKNKGTGPLQTLLVFKQCNELGAKKRKMLSSRYPFSFTNFLKFNVDYVCDIFPFDAVLCPFRNLIIL